MIGVNCKIHTNVGTHNAPVWREVSFTDGRAVKAVSVRAVRRAKPRYWHLRREYAKWQRGQSVRAAAPCDPWRNWLQPAMLQQLRQAPRPCCCGI